MKKPKKKKKSELYSDLSSGGDDGKAYKGNDERDSVIHSVHSEHVIDGAGHKVNVIHINSLTATSSNEHALCPRMSLNSID